jgi:hypothetical protein
MGYLPSHVMPSRSVTATDSSELRPHFGQRGAWSAVEPTCVASAFIDVGPGNCCMLDAQPVLLLAAWRAEQDRPDWCPQDAHAVTFQPIETMRGPSLKVRPPTSESSWHPRERQKNGIRLPPCTQTPSGDHCQDSM